MTIPTMYNSSLLVQEKILYVLSVLKNESVRESSLEITELDAFSTEEGVKEITMELEAKINKLSDRDVVSKLKEHRQW